ncbi:sensor histidine kinase [Acrocarpospora catenulata]|uniref:sensor histidine kinase n=1 Tax=Acrocarpospora catenulata TaxID=2836182 RepID=UPI001BDB15E2|nr:nitrate- and nitrite sensing domain-containing protein [Acrocarpospora catenulata]
MTLVVPPLIALIVLWAFAAGLTGVDGMRLLQINTLVNAVATPSEQVVIQLQHERLLTIAGGAVDKQRAGTDATVNEFRRLAVEADVDDKLRAQLTTVFDRLGELPAIRIAFDRGELTPVRFIEAINQIVDATFRMYDAMILVPDTPIYQQARAVTSLGQAKELLARERALIVSGLDPTARQEFTQASATRRFQYGKALAELDAELAAPYAPTPAQAAFLALEDQIAKGETPGDARAVVDSYWAEVERNQVASVDRLVARVTPAAITVLLRVGVAGGLGLVAIVLTVVICVRFTRRLTRELTHLRTAALNLAHVRLPRAVDQLQQGQEVDEPGEVPTLPDAILEIEHIGHALNSVQSTAIEAAAGQVRLRKGVGLVFLNLARRSQSLLHKQLTQLDSMERDTEDPETLEDLFRLDHLTTRMRRHAENLIILSDAVPGRGWRKPVPIVDVVRGALAEVEDYGRVSVLPMPSVSLSGSAVADLTHLIAELLENATIFSPPYTKVYVRAEPGRGGLIVEVEDRGLGMNAAEFATMNERLAGPMEFDLADSDRLGLFVVGRLAHRNNITVHLQPSPYGGTTAVVLIPETLVERPAAVEV